MIRSICRTFLIGTILLAFTTLTIVSPSYAQQVLTASPVLPTIKPLMMQGFQFHPDDPLHLDFIVSGESGNSPNTQQDIQHLVEYFLASLTISEKDLWVNLSPYEKDRIVPDSLGRTLMGQNLLAQDYVLKRMTADLISPESEAGKLFWEKVYDKFYEKYQTHNIPINVFHKIWIVPQEAIVYANGDKVLISSSAMKVMLEEDYFAKEQAEKVKDAQPVKSSEVLDAELKDILKQVVLPIIEEEVNHGEAFASLRQIYQAMILARWYKMNLKESLLSQEYVDQKKIQGVNVSEEAVQKVYQQYLELFKTGSGNIVKEDYDPETQSIVARQYFSGGIPLRFDDSASFRTTSKLPQGLSRAMLASVRFKSVSFFSARQFFQKAVVLSLMFIFLKLSVSNAQSQGAGFHYSPGLKLSYPINFGEDSNSWKNGWHPFNWSDRVAASNYDNVFRFLYAQASKASDKDKWYGGASMIGLLISDVFYFETAEHELGHAFMAQTWNLNPTYNLYLIPHKRVLGFVTNDKPQNQYIQLMISGAGENSISWRDEDFAYWYFKNAFDQTDDSGGGVYDLVFKGRSWFRAYQIASGFGSTKVDGTDLNHMRYIFEQNFGNDQAIGDVHRRIGTLWYLLSPMNLSETFYLSLFNENMTIWNNVYLTPAGWTYRMNLFRRDKGRNLFEKFYFDLDPTEPYSAGIGAFLDGDDWHVGIDLGLRPDYNPTPTSLGYNGSYVGLLGVRAELDLNPNLSLGFEGKITGSASGVAGDLPGYYPLNYFGLSLKLGLPSSDQTKLWKNVRGHNGSGVVQKVDKAGLDRVQRNGGIDLEKMDIQTEGYPEQIHRSFQQLDIKIPFGLVPTIEFVRPIELLSFLDPSQAQDQESSTASQDPGQPVIKEDDLSELTRSST